MAEQDEWCELSVEQCAALTDDELRELIKAQMRKQEKGNDG